MCSNQSVSMFNGTTVDTPVTMGNVFSGGCLVFGDKRPPARVPAVSLLNGSHVGPGGSLTIRDLDGHGPLCVWEQGGDQQQTL
jgi:hypothetical protein